MTENNPDFQPALPSKATRLKELALLFLRLGTTAFGGPAAHVALMEDEVVRRRQWLSRENFLDMLGMTNLIPGPNSTELAIHIGYERAGLAGLIVAGSCFILPAAFIVAFIAWAYLQFGKLPEANAVFYGVKPVVMAVVVQALWGLGRTAIKTKALGMIGLGCVVLNFLGVNELALIFGAGLSMSLPEWSGARSKIIITLTPVGFGGLSSGTAATSTISGAPFGLGALFLFFLKVGSVLFGSGYVLLAFIRADLVEHWHWLTEAQLMDAIAIGQITPGPVFTTATFIGYILGGPVGAVVATTGIFLPAFLFVAFSAPLMSRMRQSRPLAAFLDGVNVASLALMVVVTLELARTALVDPITVILALISTFFLLRYKINSSWLVLAGALIGLTAFHFRGVSI